jgi:hypothetical protein
LPAPANVSSFGNFQNILFETDEEGRDVLKSFVEMPRPKSLVILQRQDLFAGSNQFVDQFVREAVKVYIPILCVDDDQVPLSPSRVRMAGDRLPFFLMDNQCNFRNFVDNRFNQLKSG